jgi:hypothetical protein
MRIGAFELDEPIPELKEPYVLAILRPWIDVNNVGSLILSGLESGLGAKELGRLAKPGHFLILLVIGLFSTLKKVSAE